MVHTGSDVLVTIICGSEFNHVSCVYHPAFIDVRWENWHAVIYSISVRITPLAIAASFKPLCYVFLCNVVVSLLYLIKNLTSRYDIWFFRAKLPDYRFAWLLDVFLFALPHQLSETAATHIFCTRLGHTICQSFGAQDDIRSAKARLNLIPLECM